MVLPAGFVFEDELQVAPEQDLGIETQPGLPEGFVFEEEVGPTPEELALQEQQAMAQEFGLTPEQAAEATAQAQQAVDTGQNIIAQQLTPFSGVAGTVATPGGLEALAQGATFGFSDELQGIAQGGLAAAGAIASGQPGAGDKFKRGFETGIEKARTRLDKFRAEQPIGAIATEVAGGLLTGGFGAGRALAGAAGRTALQNIRRVGLTGAGFGALAGAGTAEGGLAERGKAAGVGAIVGAAASPVISAGARVVGGITKFTGDALGAIRNIAGGDKATKIISQSLGADEVARLTDEIQRTGKAVTDFTGDEISELLKRTRIGDKKAGKEIEKALSIQARDDLSRVEGQFNRTIGEGAEDTIEDLSAKADIDARGAFQRAEEAPALTDQKILDLVTNRPTLQRSFREAQEIAADAGVQIPTDLSQGLDSRSVFFMKKSLDNLIDGQTDIAGKVSPRGVEFIKLKDEFVGRVKELNPDFKLALERSGDKIRLRNAQEIGEKLKTNLSPDKIQDIKVKFKTPEELKAFQIGVKNSVMNKALNTDPGKAAQAIAGKRLKKEQLRAIFDDETRANELGDFLENEIGLAAQAKDVTGKSFADLASNVELVAQGGIKAPFLAKAVKRISGINDKNANEIAEILTDPKKFLGAADELKRLAPGKAAELDVLLKDQIAAATPSALTTEPTADVVGGFIGQ